jgi:hypothetical protein
MKRGSSPGNAAIVCIHVAEHGKEILYAERSTPVNKEDSGWQFVCGTVDHEKEPRAEIWALGEVIDAEPSLAEFLSDPVGTQLRRSYGSAPWVKTATSS